MSASETGVGGMKSCRSMIRAKSNTSLLLSAGGIGIKQSQIDDLLPWNYDVTV